MKTCESTCPFSLRLAAKRCLPLLCAATLLAVYPDFALAQRWTYEREVDEFRGEATHRMYSPRVALPGLERPYHQEAGWLWGQCGPATEFSILLGLQISDAPRPKFTTFLGGLAEIDYKFDSREIETVDAVEWGWVGAVARIAGEDKPAVRGPGDSKKGRWVFMFGDPQSEASYWLDQLPAREVTFELRFSGSQRALLKVPLAGAREQLTRLESACKARASQ